jgi:hypothetical protein
MPSSSRYEAARIAVFAITGAAELAYRWVRKSLTFLSHPILWPTILLFTPKLNLISFRSETAGVRFDDFILLTVITLLVCGWIVNLYFDIDPVPAVGFVVVFIFCISNLVNSRHSSILYSLRLVEYLVFFWAGRCFVRNRYNFPFLVKLLIGLNCGFILLQFAGIVGGFTAEGYESPLGSPFGISANYHAEMGALLNLAFAALAFGSKATVHFWYWCGLITLCIFLTGSRSALLAQCLLVLVYIYKHSSNKTAFALRTAAIAGLAITVFVAVPRGVSSRSADLFSRENLETFRNVYDDIPVDPQLSGVSEGGAPGEAPEGVDVSWYMRGFKWALVVKTMLAEPWTVWILGLGPGTLGPALDGGWLRLVCETGLAGTTAFVLLMRKISGLSATCSMAVVALAVNMLMIDSQNAYKVMAFLFFLAGTQMGLQFKQANATARLRAPRLRPA